MAKPFYQLQSKSELQRYFRKTKHWKELPEIITDEIVDRLMNDMKAFEVFVNQSILGNLVKNNYVPLCGGRKAKKDKNIDPDFILMMFAQTLYNSGSLFRDSLLEMDEIDLEDSQTHNWLEAGKMYYESALALEPYYIPAIYQLAILWGVIQCEYVKALKYCADGIRKIEYLENNQTDTFTYYQKMLTQSTDISAFKVEVKRLGKQLLQEEKERRKI